MSIFVIGNISGLVISRILNAIGDHITWKVFDDVFIMRCVSIDDQGAICREKLCKASERMTDVLNIFEKVQMIGIHIQDHADFWKLRKLLVYSQASVTKVSDCPTRILPPMEGRIPPTLMVGSQAPSRRIWEIMEVVVVLP